MVFESKHYIKTNFRLINSPLIKERFPRIKEPFKCRVKTKQNMDANNNNMANYIFLYSEE